MSSPSDKFYTPPQYGRYRESSPPGRRVSRKRNQNQDYDFGREKLYLFVALFCLEGILLIVASQKVNTKVSEQGMLAMGIICLVFGLLALMSSRSDGMLEIFAVLNVIVFGLSLDSVVKSSKDKHEDSLKWSQAMLGISVPGFVYFLASIIYRVNK